MTDWVPILDFPAYSVNRFGDVKFEYFARLAVPQINQTSCVYVALMRDGKQNQRSLARIVARAFLEKPVFPFNTPIHLDGNRWNCAADNLMWRPRWFAVQYHRQFKYRYDKPINRPVMARDQDEIFPNSFEAAIRYGLLERDVVLSVYNNTYAWPNYMIFEVVP